MGVILPKRFEPIRLLRKDRASSTFMATDRWLGRNEVVVKIIGRGHFTSDIPLLFDILSWYRGLRHPYISEVFDAGLTPREDLFVVRTCHPASEFFAAADIASLKTLLTAVNFLHSRGRVHGAIRPSNVFAAGGVTRLCDPWIGQTKPLVEEEVRFTAPEVLAGGRPGVDSDLYSLGAILYRFFSGRHPFEDSDIESLKAKYIWAAPRPLASVSHVSKAIGDIVTNLIHKDPDRRKPAFEALKEELDVQPVMATRAPSIGLSAQVGKTLKLLLDSPKLNAVLLEGPAGSGKSRFVEELRNLAAFCSRGRSVAVCEANAAGPHASLARSVVFLIDEQKFSVGTPSLSRLRRFIEIEREPVSGSEQEQIGHDLVSVMASISHQTRLLLVIEDFDRGSRKLAKLFEGIAQHASESEIAILLTSRPGGVPARTTGVLRAFLGDNFQQLTLELLSPPDAGILSQFFVTDQGRGADAVGRAGGNPSLLEEYCWRPQQSVIPGRVRKTLSSMVGRLPRRARRVAEALSLFEQPIGWDVLAAIAGISEVELRESVAGLDRMGLVDSRNLSIRYPDAAALLHSRIPKVKRTELHARCFHRLKEAGSQDYILARHAFHGALFDTAGMLYLQLARDKFAAKDYRAAVHFYGLVSECRAKSPGGLPLDPADQVKLAKCHAHQWNRVRARTILAQLLKSVSVAEDPDLLFSIYATLALPFVEDAVEERIRLLQLAIRCLPEDSQQLRSGYLSLAIAFLSAGHLSASKEALEAAEARCSTQEVSSQLEAVRASVFMHQGCFKDAARCLSDGQFLWATPGAVLNNLAVCLEQLGDLRTARELEMRAFEDSQSSGSLFGQVISLGNLGSMESKLGNFSAAEKFFGSAVGKLRVLRHEHEDADISGFGIVYADAALHSIQRGDYRKATEYLRGINPKYAGPFLFEVFLIALARCELKLVMGHLEAAAELLNCTKDLPLNGDFFGIERLLVEVRLQEASFELCDRLEEGLRICRRLETLYQECRVLIAIATVRLSMDDLEHANAMAREARKVARKNGYKPLAARALLLMGLSAKRDSEKEFGLKKSLEEAAEIGLTPMVAECAFRIGAWRFGCGDYIGARDYLSKSVSVTARLGEDLGSADRNRYLLLPYHREARMLLQEATANALVMPARVPELMGKENLFFIHLYRLAASMTAAADLPSATATLLEALKQSVDHSTIVVLGSGASMACHPVRTRLSEDAKRRVIGIAESAGDKPYIAGVGTNPKRDTAVWMPILSLTFRGGIYVECLPERPAMDERDIEFLTIVAAIAGAAFNRVCSKACGQGVPSSTEFCGIVGSSTTIGEVRGQIEIAASNTATVLIEGESGTGKELVARAIHERSARGKAPFIPVDCGALPEGLIEAELFGAKKGAYTGAVADRHGLFEAADHGTIFLDEISNLGLAAQAKLLRVLQEREVRRIGSMTVKTIDVRLIAATNCSLDKLVGEEKFRQDLLYRLKVLHILLPPLRDRRNDIPLLATTFLERLNAANQTRKYFGPAVLDKLLENDYPGNVRELQNAVERGFYSTSGPVISRIDYSRERRSREEREAPQSWFKDLTEGRKDFWSAIHDPYKRRDIPRERVVALVDIGLRAAHGNYKAMASMFQIPKEEYRRFMDFLRRNQCLLDFRPYRKTGEAGG